MAFFAAARSRLIGSVQRILLPTSSFPSRPYLRQLSTSPNLNMPVPRPGLIQDEAIVYGDPATVFQYLATFSNTQEWDPGCLEGKRVDSGPLKVGSKFELVTEFKGSKSEMTYEIVKYNFPEEVVLEGESKSVRVTDTIRVKPAAEDGKTHVDYQAHIQLKGCSKIFIYFLNSALNDLGKEAMDGLRKTLTQDRISELKSAKSEASQE
eukprot:TRINITY_DN9879_c0_g1_i2.p1 TRINITY_DN9879_c0_g1~~TRINITY_DN9879_c0_g1_i2.p1  ORF type:complete len:208 (+),score=35.04 TRINITY_DN9879_c0_g1_i2:80-703(+)